MAGQHGTGGSPDGGSRREERAAAGRPDAGERADAPDRGQGDQPGAAGAPGDPARELEVLRDERAHLEDQLRRALADAANMRRRQLKETEESRRRIIEGFTQELLPVLDNFELALQAAGGSDPDADRSSLVEGVRMVQRLLISALERHGLQAIEAADRDFDPSRHEAVAVETPQGVPPGRIVRVLQQGYLLGDRVLRHAKVVVAGEGGAGSAGSPPT